MKRSVRRFAGLAGAAAVLAGLSACEVGSPDTAIRTVELSVEGYYTNPDGGNMVSQNTGAPIVNLNLRQTGDQLEAIDNNGQIFRGTIGDAGASSATITLNGYTTAGNPGTISGSIDTSGTTATMRGTWIEDTMYGTVYGQATVPTNASPSGNLTINPSGSTTVARGSTATFTASGGTTYSWSVTSTAIGTVTPTTGSSVTYAAIASGTNNVTVTSGGSSKTTRVVTP